MLMAMSSTESSHKFDERKAIMQARAKLAALVGAEKAQAIYEQASREVTRGDHVNDEALIAAIERAYDREVHRDSLQ